MIDSIAEKALVNLKHPLSVSDELNVSRRFNAQTIKLTAGLHRQTWISGYPVFIDVHIENRSNKDVRKIELQLEKTVLYHDYSAPSAGIRLGDTLRVPNRLRKQIISVKQVLEGWQGVPPLAQDFRTCQMDLPTGLVSIDTGKEESAEMFICAKSVTFLYPYFHTVFKFLKPKTTRWHALQLSMVRRRK